MLTLWKRGDYQGLEQINAPDWRTDVTCNSDLFGRHRECHEINSS